MFIPKSNLQRLWILVLVPAVTGTITLAVYLSNKITTPPGSIQLVEAKLQPESTPIVLPHKWVDKPEQRTQRYQFNFKLSEVPGPDTESWSVFLPQLEQNVAITLNGNALAVSGQLSPYPSRYSIQSLLVPAPNSYWQAGDNEMLIELHSFPAGQGFLGPVIIGSQTALRAEHERRKFWHYDILWVFTITGILAAIVLAALGRFRPGERDYGWLSAALFFWCMHMGWCLIREPTWVSTPWIHSITGVLACWFCFSYYQFALTHTAVNAPALYRANIWAASLISVATISLTLWNDALATTLNPIAIGLSLLFVIPMRYKLVQQQRIEPRFEISLQFYSTAVLLVFAIFTLTISAGVNSTVGGQYLFFLTPIILIQACLLLLRRFVLALRAAETLAAQLEQRVADKTAEIDQNYRQMLVLEQEKALAEERERIMRDMHDGVGGYLVSSIMRLRKLSISDQQIERTLQHALTDLRLMIDSLEASDGDLNVALGMLRQRLEPELKKLGLHFEWAVESVPYLEHLAPHDVLQIMRIVQEAVTNILKHANATAVRVEVTSSEESVSIVVADNGRGLDNAETGNGMNNMRKRAQQIGASIKIENSDTGVTVRLTLPTVAGAAKNER